MKGDSLNVENVSEVDLIQAWIFLKSRLLHISIFVIGMCIIMFLSTFLMQETYKAQATLLPLEQSGGMGNMASFIGQFSLKMAKSVKKGSSGGSVSKLTVILKSRNLTEKVIKEMNLMPVLFPGKWDAKKDRWKEGVEVPELQRGISKLMKMVETDFNNDIDAIEVVGIMPNQEIVADVINTYVRLLQRRIAESEFTIQKKNRLFLEKQLANNKIEAIKGGKELSEFYKDNRVSSVDANIDISLDVIGETGDDELFLSSNPGMKDLINALSKVESLKEDRSDVLKYREALKDVPQQVYLDYLQDRQQVLLSTYSMLASKYEMAKIDEAKNELTFEVIDRAYKPLGIYSPKRKLMVAATFIISVFLSVVYVFFKLHMGIRQT
jgi:uncharacterized protein involved in exopolysaccharide biosynthesis